MKHLFPIVCCIGFLMFSTEATATPQCDQVDLFVSRMDGNVQYRIPVLLATNAGTLLAACEARVSKPGDAPNDIDVVLKRSEDNGLSWSSQVVVFDNGNGAAGDPTGLVDRETGTIWLFANFYPEGFGSVNVDRGISGNTATYMAVKSDDDGKSWSAPINLTAMLKEPEWRGGSIGPGTGIQLRSGRLVLPRYYFESPKGDVRRDTSFVSYSDDHGVTWKNGGMVSPGGVTNECQVVELMDGSLLLNMRNEGFTGEVFRKVARSFDGGETWSESTDDRGLIEPRHGCQASLIRHTGHSMGEKSRLIFSNPASLRRDNFYIRLSYDEGETWSVARQLHGGPAAYSSLAILSDRTIGCLYERGDDHVYEKITFARVNLEWLSRGRDALETSVDGKESE